MIVLPENVTSTWTAPYRVWTADPVIVVVAAAEDDEDDEDNDPDEPDEPDESDGVGVDDAAAPPLVVSDDSDPDPELVVPVPDAVEWTDVDAAVTWSPTPYSFRPTVAPMTTRMTVKRTVPRQDLLFMTCSVLLGG
ncbi:hypothetical protein [Leifsonia sp. 1010]|uniref:hypothetical protein n=1 Tax=Leifsonia sp. 1010 TaxID=2817769 RepID=UPI002858EC11|nr:hypothetical protein [Leifsonia sp. 1010]MDR6611570.1 hypothetical protein [Leifsonia sp. 1010]